jgi:hypothetical protein
MLPPLHALFSRVRLLGPVAVLLGTPQRATIAPYACGGYMLLIDYTDGRERLDLADRYDNLHDYDHPDDRDFTAAADHLAARGLAWVLPWALDQHGNLTAPIVPVAREESHR